MYHGERNAGNAAWQGEEEDAEATRPGAESGKVIEVRHRAIPQRPDRRHLPELAGSRIVHRVDESRVVLGPAGQYRWRSGAARGGTSAVAPGEGGDSRPAASRAVRRYRWGWPGARAVSV
jgi:hypothetical protein